MPIKNILFDLGGVILDIDYHLTVEAFRGFGFENFDRHYTQAAQSGIFDDFEIGAMSDQEFLNRIKEISPIPLDDKQIRSAWNALLLPWNTKRLELLKTLQNQYRLFLFSNTNAMHKAYFDACFPAQRHMPNLESLFEKAYFSHIFGKRKPHPESFTALLNENQIKPEETLFIDDSPQHVEGARKAGLIAYHLENSSIEALDFETLGFLTNP